MIQSPSSKRQQTLPEEIANSVSHGIGFLAAIVAAPLLIDDALERGGMPLVVGASIFCFTAGLLYLTSMLYHAIPTSRAKQIFQLLDHSAIFFLIAGTYTPFMLGVLRGAWGWGLLLVIWSLALVGVGFKVLCGFQYPKVSVGLYLGMGWAGVVVLKPLWQLMPPEGIFWLFSGGLAYTAGVVFYAADRLRYSHFVWHLFVLAGTACHFVAVLRYSA